MQNMEKIYEQYFETVYKYLFCLTHDGNISEDLTQETFYKAVKKIDTYKGNCKISVWLCQIAKNLWYDHCRRKKIEIKATNTFLDEEYRIEEQVILNEEKDKMYKRINQLDKKTRDVMYLRITGELSFKEIGDIMDKTENWARVTFYRGKNKVKEDEGYERKGM